MLSGLVVLRRVQTQNRLSSRVRPSRGASASRNRSRCTKDPCHTTTPRSSHPANITCFSLRRSDLAIQGFSVMTCSAALQRSDIAVTEPQFWATPTRRLLLTAGKDLPLLPVAQRFSEANLLRTQMCFFQMLQACTEKPNRCSVQMWRSASAPRAFGRRVRAVRYTRRAMHGAGEAATAAHRRGTDTRRASCRASAPARRT